MQHTIDVLVMVVNYSHDIATAFLAVSALTMWVLSRRYPDSGDPDLELYYIRVYRSVTRIAKDSLYWILLAGVPRVIYYTDYEWSDMAGNLQVIAIVIKHIVMFGLVGGGLYYWLQLSKKVKILKLNHNMV